jgi:hypothetical protein
MLRIRLGGDFGNNFFMILGVTLLLCGSQIRTHDICFENSYSKICSFFGVARSALPLYLGGLLANLEVFWRIYTQLSGNMTSLAFLSSPKE